jgi:ABC-2 type transport system permease protein
MIGALIATGKDDDWARYISPFKYFDITYIIKNAAYELPYLLTGAAIITVSIIVGYIVYNRKDIHAVS